MDVNWYSKYNESKNASCCRVKILTYWRLSEEGSVGMLKTMEKPQGVVHPLCEVFGCRACADTSDAISNFGYDLTGGFGNKTRENKQVKRQRPFQDSWCSSLRVTACQVVFIVLDGDYKSLEDMSFLSFKKSLPLLFSSIEQMIANEAPFHP